ncbi:MAG: hypothetical protein Q9168_006382 [Polycauliona sp. 1 TL-2023]
MAAIAPYPARSDLNGQTVPQREPDAFNFSRPNFHELPIIHHTLMYTDMQQKETGHRSRAQPAYSQSSVRRKYDASPLAVQQPQNDIGPTSDPTQREVGEKLSRNGTPSSTKAPSNVDSSYLSPPRRRPALSDKSRSGSEADSLLDLYGHPRSVVEGVDKNERDVTLDDLYNQEQEDSDSSRWIHRDKLAAIESHEMQEAGIKLPRQMRSKSSLRHKKSHSRNQSTTSFKSQEQPEVPATTGAREGKRQKVQAPPQQEVYDDPMDFDLRTPEERALDNLPQTGPSAMYHQPNLGRSGSRIPVPKSYQSHVERNTPHARTRGASGNWSAGDEEEFSYNKIRSRSNSVGSRVLLDGPEANGTPTPARRPSSRGGIPNSPPKQRHVSKAGSINNGRPQTSSGTRNISEPQKLRSSPAFPRPRSRTGIEPPRPGTAINRPEGEAPWIADMYKPDPRLPQDQQMLPTHAKRLQQEQKEREMKAAGLSPQQPPPTNRTPEPPNAKTRTPSPVSPISNNTLSPHQSQKLDFNPPTPNHPSHTHQPPTPRSNDENSSTPSRPIVTTNNTPPSNPQWPLRVAPPIKPPTNPPRNNYHHNTSPIIQDPHHQQQHAGYSTIPKVSQSTPPLGALPSPKTMMPQPMEQEKPKVREKEGGCCGGCVVM